MISCKEAFQRNKARFFLLVLSGLFTPWSLAQCSIGLDQIQPGVQETLQPLHVQINMFIPKRDFELAYSQLVALDGQIRSCAEYFREFEYENYSYERWGETSRKYDAYANELALLIDLIQAGYESFELGIWRTLSVKHGSWEKEANRYYDLQIRY